MEELDKQKRQLSRKVTNLVHKWEQQNELGHVNNMRKIGENSMLISELNDMRKTNR